MHFLKTIIFIGLGIILIHCGNQNNKQETVKVDRIEEGVAKAADGRIILSSQSDTHLIIPEGGFTGFKIDSTKLARMINIRTTKRISSVYNLSFSSSVHIRDAIAQLKNLFREIDTGDIFTTSFSVQTDLGVHYHEIQCGSNIQFSKDDASKYYLTDKIRQRHDGRGNWVLYLTACESDEVSIGKWFMIPMQDIVVDQKKFSAKIRDHLQSQDETLR